VIVLFFNKEKSILKWAINGSAKVESRLKDNQSGMIRAGLKLTQLGGRCPKNCNRDHWLSQLLCYCAKLIDLDLSIPYLGRIDIGLVIIAVLATMSRVYIDTQETAFIFSNKTCQV